MNVTLLIDNPVSWIRPYAQKLKRALQERGHRVTWCENAKDVPRGDCAFFLSCERIVAHDVLARNTHNLVVHESALPHGKGWAPLTWQILEGKHHIPITLFEATEQVDAGPIYLQDVLVFEGHELCGELRDAQGKKTIELVLRFLDSYPPNHGTAQEGGETWFPRRTPKDSIVDPDKTIAEQFDLLRVADNKRYPAFFRHRGHTYILKIYKRKNQSHHATISKKTKE